MRTNFISNFIACACFAIAISLSGCAPKVPADMPKLQPCTITVRQDGQPLSDAAVVLFSMDPSLAKWAASGKTDASGNVTVKTHGKYPGVPVGEFKILVTKTETEAPVIIQEETETEKEKSVPGKTYTLVDEQFGNPTKTPLTITVSAGKNSQSVDVGASLRKEIKSN